MALGTFGSTLNDELNRLANGGTYRTMASMVDEALAAKQWANRENINPYSTDTVGILNEIAGLGTNRQNWLDFNGVCNYIAGTTGLPAAAALRQVYNTTDLLTSQSAYYIDATDASASGQTVTNLGTAGSLLPTTLGSSTSADSNDPIFLSHTGTNYVYFPGSQGNLISVPDASNLDITGDIDLRWYGALDDWTPAGNGGLIDKRLTNLTEISYGLRISTSGQIVFTYSTDGTTTSTVPSSVSAGIADGAAKWVRATFDADNGAGGNTTTFYTSDDGTTWTQLGTTVTNSGTVTIYSGTGLVYTGANPLGGYSYTGKFFRYQIFAGLDGTDKRLDVDTSVITAGSATSLTAVTGQTATIGRTTGGRKTVAVTQPTWLFGTDDYMEVNNRYMAHSGSNYLYLPGVASNYARTPDAAALDITGDIDLRCKVAMDDWTPSTATVLVAKWSTGTAKSYALGLTITTGTLYFAWTPDGTVVNTITSTVAPTVADGATLWVRATMDVDNGASGNDVKFFTSTDGTNWTQLGNTVTTAGVATINNSTGELSIGAQLAGANSFIRGKVFRAQVRNGIDGTVAFDANFETSITSLEQASFTESSANAATVTINRSGSTYRSAGITTAGYLYPGATNTFTASATDFLNHGLNSFSFGLVYRQWITPTSSARIMYKGTTSGGRYLVGNSGTTLAGVAALNDGTTQNTRTSSVPANGTLNELVAVVNRDTSIFTNYFNNEAISNALTAGNVDNPLTLVLGQASGGSSAYADMELVAAYVFRQALTAAQVRQITNYFANREVYL